MNSIYTQTHTYIHSYKNYYISLTETPIFQGTFDQQHEFMNPKRAADPYFCTKPEEFGQAV